MEDIELMIWPDSVAPRPFAGPFDAPYPSLSTTHSRQITERVSLARPSRQRKTPANLLNRVRQHSYRRIPALRRTEDRCEMPRRLLTPLSRLHVYCRRLEFGGNVAGKQGILITSRAEERPYSPLDPELYGFESLSRCVVYMRRS